MLPPKDVMAMLVGIAVSEPVVPVPGVNMTLTVVGVPPLVGVSVTFPLNGPLKFGTKTTRTINVSGEVPLPEAVCVVAQLEATHACSQAMF